MVGLVLKAAGHNLKVTAAAQEKGLLTVPAGCNVIRLLPALIATTQELSKSVAILDEVFSEQI
jgi:acetylornithine/succinyldiaminopimelate/putrescine aminotransferase